MDRIRIFARCSGNANFYNLEHDDKNMSQIFYGNMAVWLNLLNLPSFEIVYNQSHSLPMHVMVSTVYDGLADIAAIPAAFTAKRSEYIDYSYPIQGNTVRH